MVNYHFNIIQRSEEWDFIRLGKITGSEFNNLINPTSKNKYLFKKATEILLNVKAENDIYFKIDIDRGIALENSARLLTSKVLNKNIVECGFVENDDAPRCGFSPDGLIDDNAIIEIKCPRSYIYLQRYMNNNIDFLKFYDKNIYWQIMFGLYITNRDYCYYVNYNEEFLNKKLHNICILKIEKNIEAFKIIKNIIDKANNKIDEILLNFKNN